MNFKTASAVESTVWQMRLSDYPRGLNRSKINDLFNGFPPYSDTEVQQNNIATNVNFLEGTKLAHDARRQFYNAFLKPGNFFSVNLDSGPKHKRKAWSHILTKEVNKQMKRDLPYFEMFRSCFASVVLHGIGPSLWKDRYSWRPDFTGIEDVMLPGSTLLTMANLPFFAVSRKYTAYELHKMTHGPKVDPAWQMGTVNALLKWADQESAKLMGSSWPDVWSPEKMSERMKSDGGLYSSDSVPTIDCWDFYFWNDDNKQAGWNRRIILDANSAPGISGIELSKESPKGIEGTKGQFLYNPGDRLYGDKINEIVHFQFGDLSAVAPFRYHSVRSLGFLIYAVCHLQNRLRCKFNDALFESMLQYFRVSNPQDAEKVLKINLVDKGVIEEGVDFVKGQDRWQVNQALVESGLNHNTQIMGGNSAAFISGQKYGSEQDNKTATQVMAEVNSATSLVSAALLQAYAYQVFQYREICRRFCLKNSPDAGVRKFRVEALKSGVPEEHLNSEAWEVDPERVMGAGNKMLEMTIAQQLMQYRNLYDPEPQREILRDFTLAVSDDPGLADQLVPEQPVRITDSVHDAQLVAGVLMQGLPVAVKTGMNHIEYVEALLASMNAIIAKVEQQQQSMATADQFGGLNNMAQHISQHIAMIAQDKNEKQRVKQYGDDLGKMMNMVRAYGQRLEQAQKAAMEQGQGGNGQDPKDAAKVKAMMMQAQAKSDNTRESHAQRTAQRQAQWELEQKRKDDEHRIQMQRDADIHGHEMNRSMQELGADIQTQAVKTGAETELKKNQAKSLDE